MAGDTTEYAGVLMTSEQIAQNNELGEVALDAEKRMEQAAQMIKMGNITVALTHIKQAHNGIHRILCDLERE